MSTYAMKTLQPQAGEKIAGGPALAYVYGVSWTSILGVWLVQQYPDLYYAYIGNGQMVDTTENDVMGYQFALDYLTKKGDTQTVEMLRRNGPPPYTDKDMLKKYVAFLDVLNDSMGSPRYTVVVPLVPFVAPEYGYVDKINHTRGQGRCQRHVVHRRALLQRPGGAP